MRLKSLWVDGFKNLKDFNIDFENKDGITVLIGNNASGKSNILEAISAIFAGLYNNTLEDLTFKFDLFYQIYTDTDALGNKLNNKRYIEVRLSKKRKVKHRIRKVDRKSFKVINKEQIYKNKQRLSPNRYFPYYFPSQIIALYSGEELRLWEDYYQDFYLKHNRAVIDNKKSVESFQNMLYINKYYWDIALLTMLVSDINISDIVGEFDWMKMEFNLENLEKFNSNEVTQFVEFVSGNETSVEFNLDDFKTFSTGETHKRLFDLLCISYLPKDPKDKLITSLELYFKNGTTTKDLSEGQKKQILLKLALEVLADENSLLLFDEPDAHIHISNKKLIPEMLKDYDNREIILTTHSPTLSHSFDNKHLAYIENGKINTEYNNKEKLLSELTNGLIGVSEQQILLQSNKKIVLLVEGNSDKKHIETALDKLKNDYSSLEFDVFSMGGCQNIKQFILGVKRSNIFDNNKTYIAIFDTDKDGVSCHDAVNGNTKDDSNFHSMKLSEDKNFEIEHMYSIGKQKEAYQKALENFCGGGENNNIDIKRVEKSAKYTLAENCKNFEESDFDRFKALFDLILGIKSQS